MDTPTPPSLLDPALLTAVGLAAGTALKTLVDHLLKRLRPQDDPQHETLRRELLGEAEALRKELRTETRELKEEVEQLRKEVDRWKNRYYRLLALLAEMPEVRQRLALEIERIADEVV
jgi:molecular chaperone GrpE (heat shock protein)